MAASPRQNVHRRKSGLHLRFRMMQRNDGRAPDEIRPINFELNVAPHASGSVLVSMGKTRVICSVTIEDGVPRWMKEQGVTGGWLTAEYWMLPYSTQPRTPARVLRSPSPAESLLRKKNSMRHRCKNWLLQRAPVSWMASRSWISITRRTNWF